MNSADHIFLFYFILSFIHHFDGAFTPDTSDYDAYGLKIAMNEHFLVLAQNDNRPPTFLLQFAPYNDTQKSAQCFITYPDTTTNFIYTVALGKKQNLTHFFFAGEQMNGETGAFVGIAIFNETSGSANTYNKTTFPCNTGFSYSLQYLNNYEHQEYYILGVEPNGILAYGFSNDFTFVFDSRNSSTLKIWNASMTWPDASFIPHAVDMSEKFGVVAGFIRNASNTTVKYSPMIYLVNFNSSNHHPIIVNQYKPIATPMTWQDLLTNSDANVYSAKYDMSVSINDDGDVLVGMQFINRVFLFSVNTTNPTRLTYVSRYTNGRSLGNGKGVAWLDNGIAAVLINIYSLSYEWSLSQVFIFDIHASGYISNSTPLSVFPNSHQLSPGSFSSVFLNIISSPSSLALLDDQGKILIFTPTPPGFYPIVSDTKLMPFVTSPQLCMPGAYKNKVGVHDCVLCPSGTKNPGNSSTECISCLFESFCPLGAVEDVSESALEAIFQVIAYPRSPESIIFDEILIRNMFTIGSGRCVIVSPLFWTLVVAGFVIVIIVIMEMMHLFVKHPYTQRVRKILKYVFKHTDLLGEGEFWVGGLASLSVIVLISFAFAFSNSYLKQYPIETSSDSNFACDTSMRNAKFETNVQSLAIPFSSTEQEMFDLLNDQEFTLNLDFVNTLVNCDAISIQALFGLTWSTIRWLNCNNTNSILTLSIPLPYQHVSVQVFLADTKTMGGLRIGLSGPGSTDRSFTLKELNFHQSYSKNGQILARILPVSIEMTKVINQTEPMVGEEAEFSGIYIATFTVDMNSLFFTNDQYVRSPFTLTTLTIVITETPYYVKNLQEPIARQSEIVFRNLLFTIVCLEIFGLIFLAYKLLLKPLYHSIVRKKLSDKEKNIINETQIHAGS